MSEFYEEDEPVEKVRAAYERGAKGVTGPPAPRDPNQRAKRVVDSVIAKTEAVPAESVSIEIGPRDVLIPARAFDPSEHQLVGLGS